MGLSFHYNGRFSRSASLRSMIEEVEDVAKIYNWKYHVFEIAFPDGSRDMEEYDQSVYGICFSPEKCEPIFLCFLSNGKMSSPQNLQIWGKDAPTPNEQFLYLLSTKTQYAGYEVHMVIIHLLKYLGGKYFVELHVTDESSYWERGDKTLVKEAFERYNQMMDNFSLMLENIPARRNETIDEFINRLFAYIENKQKP